MARVVLLASRARRIAVAETADLRAVIVTGCGLALILAKGPLGF